LSALPPIKWVCPYCRQAQETPDLMPFEGEDKPYRQIILDAAKDGTVMCLKCYHRR
jgi:hypothetical protein